MRCIWTVTVPHSTGICVGNGRLSYFARPNSRYQRGVRSPRSSVEQSCGEHQQQTGQKVLHRYHDSVHHLILEPRCLEPL